MGFMEFPECFAENLCTIPTFSVKAKWNLPECLGSSVISCIVHIFKWVRKDLKCKYIHLKRGNHYCFNDHVFTFKNYLLNGSGIM